MNKPTELMMIVDKGATGMTHRLTLPIVRDDWRELIGVLQRFALKPLEGGRITVREDSFVRAKGGLESTVNYTVTIEKELGAFTSYQYNFVRSNQNYFLNVDCCPTILAVGSNTFPALITGAKEYEGDHPAHASLKALNRLAFDVLGKRGFKANLSAGFWERVSAGDINIHSMQAACYSKDLGENRDSVMIAIRKLCGGQINLREEDGSEISASLSSLLNVKFISFDNDRCNFSFGAYSGGAKEFNLTCYRKDRYLEIEEMSKEAAKKGPSTDAGREREKALVRGSIRFDLTLTGYWLERTLKVKTIADLERVYFERCEANGYDKGFMEFLMNSVFKRIKLTSLLSVDRKNMMYNLSKLDDKVEEDRKYVNTYSIKDNVSKWLSSAILVAYFDGHNFNGTIDDLIHTLNRKYGISLSRDASSGIQKDVRRAKTSVRRALDENYSLDIDVPWQFFMAALVNADNSNYSLSEMRELAFGSDNQERVSLLDLRKRTSAMMNVVSDGIFSGSKEVGLKKYVPIEIGYKDCMLFNAFSVAPSKKKAAK
jgi:hypothetical protein